MFGSGFLKVLVVCSLLFSRFELSDHNRGLAALMPMMVGIVRMAAVMGSNEAHKLTFHSKQLVL